MARFISASDPLHILLVEDSKGDAILIQKALQQALPDAHHVQRAANLATALKAVAEHNFDVVLLDRSLPDVVEFSGLNSIQNMAPQLPIIFLTGLSDEGIALRAVENGAQDYLLKDKVDSHTIKRAIQFAIHRKQFESILINQANFDALTGLANRTLFESRLDMALARMKRQHAGIAIFFMDLDGFKAVNDTLGHQAGDQLLKEVSTRLKHSIRAYDTAARFGGDEFALLIEGTSDQAVCGKIAQKILHCMAEPFSIIGNTQHVGISIGIITCDDGAIPRAQLMVQADAAMYEAKKNHGQTFKFADSIISKLA